jgi:NAD(P)-dependent dehydrogenase (short-subunit alcohol dehydrogenase family)
MEIKNKTAIITGGARRVGKAITLALAHAGANVVINYNTSRDEAEQTLNEVRAFGVKAIAVQADIGQFDQVRVLANAAIEQFGAVDILVNGAAPFEQTPMPTNDLADWHRITNILIHGTMYLANSVAPQMIKRGSGVIINIVDLYAWHPRKNFAAHSVGKAGMLQLTRQLALEYAPNVRVNAVAPGPVLPPPEFTPERIALTAARTLLNRWGTPQDVADAVLFLVRADFITAQTIVVDGGEEFGRYK